MRKKRRRAQKLSGSAKSHFSEFDVYADDFDTRLVQLKTATACTLPTAVDIAQHYGQIGVMDGELRGALDEFKREEAAAQSTAGVSKSKLVPWMVRRDRLRDFEQQLNRLAYDKVSRCKRERLSGFGSTAFAHKQGSSNRLVALREDVHALASTTPCTPEFWLGVVECYRQLGQLASDHNHGGGITTSQFNTVRDTLRGLTRRGICLRDPKKRA